MPRLKRVSHLIPLTLLLIGLVAITANCAFAEVPNSAPASFPTADKWTGNDFREAVQFITQTATDHPEKLPRANEDDGRFNILIANLNDFIGILDIADREDWKEVYEEESRVHLYFTSEILMPLFSSYGVSIDEFNIIYEREILILLPLVIETMGLTIKKLRFICEDSIDNDPATWPEGFQEKITELTRVSGTTTNALIRVIIRPGDRHPDLRSKIIADCQESMQHLLWAMNEADRNMANMTLEILKETLEEPPEHIAIDKLIQCERLPVHVVATEPEQD